MTRGQRNALTDLLVRHSRFPHHRDFAAVHLGANTVAHLRKIEDTGFVKIDRTYHRWFYSITDAGREALR